MKKFTYVLISLLFLFCEETIYAQNTYFIPNVNVSTNFDDEFVSFSLHNASETPVIVAGSILDSETGAFVDLLGLEIPSNGRVHVNSRDLSVINTVWRNPCTDQLIQLPEGNYTLLLNEFNAVNCPLAFQNQELSVNITGSYFRTDPLTNYAEGSRMVFINDIPRPEENEEYTEYRVAFVNAYPFTNTLITVFYPEFLLYPRMDVYAYDLEGEPVFVAPMISGGLLTALSFTADMSVLTPTVSYGTIVFHCEGPCFVDSRYETFQGYSVNGQ